MPMRAETPPMSTRPCRWVSWHGHARADGETLGCSPRPMGTATQYARDLSLRRYNRYAPAQMDGSVRDSPIIPAPETTRC